MSEADAVISRDSTKLIGEPVSLRDSSGQQTGARNGAGWGRCVEAGQPGSLRGKFVEVRRLDLGSGIVHPQIAVTEIIDRDEQNIGAILSSG